MSNHSDWLQRGRQIVMAVFALTAVTVASGANLIAAAAWVYDDAVLAAWFASFAAPCFCVIIGRLVHRLAREWVWVALFVLALALPAPLYGALFVVGPTLGQRTLLAVAAVLQIAMLAVGAVTSARAPKRWRSPNPRCPTCSYPLTGLPPDAPCPECGARINRQRPPRP